jgi:hypothetical protein
MFPPSTCPGPRWDEDSSYPAGMRTRPELLLAVVALLVGGSLAGVATAAVLAPRAAAERERADELAAEVAALEARVA